MIIISLTVIVSVWLSSAVVVIFEVLSILVDPLLEYLARISSAEIVSVGWDSICELSSSGILRSRRCEVLLWPTNRRRNADIALDERFSFDLVVVNFKRIYFRKDYEENFCLTGFIVVWLDKPTFCEDMKVDDCS